LLRRSCFWEQTRTCLSPFLCPDSQTFSSLLFLLLQLD
jgi:hypothetical protein